MNRTQLQKGDRAVFLKNGSEYISGLIRRGLDDGTNTATVRGRYEIASAVRLPSDFTLVLDGCHLKMASGVFDNMFVNEGLGTGRENKNIRLLGQNGAVLDGGEYNGLSERNSGRDGMPPIWKNNLILCANVKGFEMGGFSCVNQRWWAMNFLFCSRGHLHDISFTSSDILLEPDGSHTHGLVRDRYGDILVKNSDGIDLRQGCRDILIENVTGFTEDDSVALTGLQGQLEQEFAVPGAETDICRITIKNVATAAFCSNVRLLNQGGLKLHDILIDGITDTSETCPHMDVGIHTLRIGDTHMYGSRHATADETYNIRVKNLVSRAAVSAVALAGEMTNVEIDPPLCAIGTVDFIDSRGR